MRTVYQQQGAHEADAAVRQRWLNDRSTVDWRGKVAAWISTPWRLGKGGEATILANMLCQRPCGGGKARLA